jgi:DNA-binding transcriptional LysR family regulator
MFDWNDLRYFLAVARGGSTLGASRTLGVNQTTVARRIEALEHALGGKLFDRGQTGSRLTEVGTALIAAAETVESAAQNVCDISAALARQHSGVLRVTTNEALASFAVTPALAEFRRLYPDIKVELIISDRFFDLTKGEADLAIRGATKRPADPGVVARRLVNVDWGFYCSLDYLERHGRPRSVADLNHHILIGGEGDLGMSPPLRWMTEHAPNAEIHCRSNTLTNMVASCKAGLGVAPLPNLMAAVETDLVCCIPPTSELEANVWLLTTPELKSSPRVRAFIDFIVPNVIARSRAIIEEADRREAAMFADAG